MSTVSSDDTRMPSGEEIYELRSLIPHCMALRMEKREASDYLAWKFNIPGSWSNAVWDEVEIERRNAIWLFKRMQRDQAQQSLHPQSTYNNNTQHLNAPHMGGGTGYPQQPPALQDQDMGRGRSRHHQQHLLLPDH